ncbi:hypothetical protein [Streptosporangium sp. NPDC006007]|uniref:hypothetical protein n=1 Tax=Streptosporangium sp. NPDC006007 TaxID=3154575 RepID=UPI0033AA2E3C
MAHHSAPILDRAMASRGGCGCFADTAPMPMGCAVCGHAPYAHGCPYRAADHEYAQPSGALMETRLEARRHGGPCILPAAEPPADVAPTEVIPLVPAQRRPDLPAPAAPAAPAVQPTQPPLPRRVRRPFPTPGARPAATRPPRRGDNQRPAPSVRASAHNPSQARAAPPTPRPAAPDQTSQSLLPHHISRTRPTPRTSERVLNRTMEVRPMENATAKTAPVIPGWRVIISDRGRFWAFRRTPFPIAAMRAGADPAVDADTLDAVQAEVGRQEEIAERVAS